DDVAGGLDVDRPVHHRHQLLSERHEIGRDVGILVAVRPRMHAGNEEPRELEKCERVGADEREIEVARAGAVGVERRARLPAPAGQRAAAENDDGAGRDDLVYGAAEFVEPLATAAKGKADDIVALLLLRKAALDGL